MIDYDRLATQYAQHRHVHPVVLRSLCQSVNQDSKVLEVGCGTGNYIIAIASTMGCACWGIDHSEKMLSQARKRSNQVRLQIGRAEHLDFTGVFDLVFSVDVIHHVDDRAAYYCTAYHALKPGGLICTATDSGWIVRHREPLATYFPETVAIELERYPRIAELAAMMKQAGFGKTVETMVEHRYELFDIQAYRDKAYSALHMISEQAFRQGIERMERDLRTGTIPCVSRYTLLWGEKPT
jgi:ubiquinone/menaquinone biosynthesis C-methylase UbiE